MIDIKDDETISDKITNFMTISDNKSVNRLPFISL